MRCASVQNERQCVASVGPDGKHKGLHESQYRARQWANEDDPRCMKYVHGRASVTLCGREIKDEGLCGPHLGAKRRSNKRDQERQTEADRTRQRREELRTLAATLSGHLGVAVAPYFNVGGYGSDHLMITADAARALLAGQEATS